MSNLAIASSTTSSGVAIREALKTSLYPGASDQSVDMVLAYCQAAQLDPMTKPVHIVPVYDSKIRGMRDVVMPGVGLYRTIAARSGCAGVSEPEFGPDVNGVIGGVSITYPQWCRVSVKRRLQTGEIVEFVARELWIENYAQKGGQEKSAAPNAMWTKRPYGQLAKCAEAQALRKAFPEVGAQPTADEMEGKELEHVSDAKQALPAPAASAPEDKRKPYAQSDFDKNFPQWVEVITVRKVRTPDQILGLLDSGFLLTPEQRAKIAAIGKASATDAQDGREGASLAEQGLGQGEGE